MLDQCFSKCKMRSKDRNVRPSSRYKIHKTSTPRKHYRIRGTALPFLRHVLSTEACGDHFQFVELDLILEVSWHPLMMCFIRILTATISHVMTFSLSRVYLPHTNCLGLRPAQRDIPGSIVTCRRKARAYSCLRDGRTRCKNENDGAWG